MEPHHRDRVEGELSDAQLDALREQCADLGIPLDRWHVHPMLAVPWSTVAIRRLSARLRRVSPKMSRTESERIAAGLVGVAPGTFDQRIRRLVERRVEDNAA